jgi:hypothetical protein
MLRTFFLYVLLASLLTAGCAPSNMPEPLNTPTVKPLATSISSLDGNWRIKMKHSGGIMGLSRSIDITSDGTYIVEDERASAPVMRVLNADDLSKLTRQINSLEAVPSDMPDGSGCADCFLYDLEIQRNGEKITIQLNDINLTDSGFEALVTYLQSLINAALS